MAVTGAILPTNMPMKFPKWTKEKYFPMQHLPVIDKKNRRRNVFVISNIVSIVLSPSMKSDQNEVHAIKDLLKCSMSSAYCKKKASTKRVHLIAQVHNTEVKWSFKTCIVRKKVRKASRQKLFEWIIKNSYVCESPIARDTLLITYAESWVKRILPKTLTGMFHATVTQWYHSFTKWWRFTLIQTCQYKWCDDYWHTDSLFSTSLTTSNARSSQNDVWLCHLKHFKVLSGIIKCTTTETIKNHER